ncbi:MAG TPA: hypothetical protein VKP69_18865, partial [Isosphaeraceae bacterium]|nr:hypothetical protein [Isosphaeraceae bacterium]
NSLSRRPFEPAHHPMDDLSRFCCQNSDCPDAGRRGAGNLTVTGRLGKHRQYRLLYCRTCRARFSERGSGQAIRAHLVKQSGPTWVTSP